MVIFKNTLLFFWHTLVLAMNSISCSFFQTKGANVKIIIQKIFHHAVRPFGCNAPFGHSSFFQFPFMANHGRCRDSLICKIVCNFSITRTGDIKFVNQFNVFRFLWNDFQNRLIFFISAITKGRLCHQSTFFLSGSDGTLDFFTGILYITFIEPCLNSNGIVARIHRIIIIINDNQMLSTLLKLIQKQKNLCIMPAKTRKVFDIYRINIFIQIGHHLLKSRSVKDIAGNAIIFVPTINDCTMISCILVDD